MKRIRIEKLTLNIGAGKEQAVLNKGINLLKQITGINPVKTVTQKRLAAWGLRPGLPIGCKITLRNSKARELLQRLLVARENTLQESNFDNYGNVAFGIPEYIDIPNAKYDPAIGIMGLQACVTLDRPGFRIKKRKIMKTKIKSSHKINKQEAIEYFRTEFKIKVGEEE